MMSNRFENPRYPLLVYTDLDGTLLDHDSYSFAPATPALARLKGAGVPVIPVTSKTLEELEVLTGELALEGPCIAENGGLIAIPRGYFPGQEAREAHGGYEIEYLSPRYADILALLAGLRETHGFDFAGFADLSVTDVASLTGLNDDAAGRARARLCSEPLVWRDSDAAFAVFSRELAARGCTLLKGGRFWHVLGDTDKAVAIDRLDALYRAAGFTAFTRVALGDSPNDARMLAGADIAVVVRRKDGDWLEVECHGERIRTEAPGPQGWNAFFMQYLDRLDAGNDTSNTKRTLHG